MHWPLLICLFNFVACANRSSTSTNLVVLSKENGGLITAGANENLIFQNGEGKAPGSRRRGRLFPLNLTRYGDEGGGNGEKSEKRDGSDEKIKVEKISNDLGELSSQEENVSSQNEQYRVTEFESSPLDKTSSVLDRLPSHKDDVYSQNESDASSEEIPLAHVAKKLKVLTENTTVVNGNAETLALKPTPAFSRTMRLETTNENVDGAEKLKTNLMENDKKRKIRKPVKLNMKQGLIMNQVLSTYGLSEFNNSLCRSHVDEFKAGLRALEPWAIKMFDASSKLMSGILGGNLAEFGSYQQCLNIYEDTPYGPTRGKHCTLHIHPTDELLKIVLSYRKKISEKHFQNLKQNVLDDVRLSWSVCVPDSCGHEDVLKHFSKSIVDVTEGLNLTLSLAEEHCITLEDLPELTSGDYAYIFCVGLVLIIVAISTIIDMTNEDNTNELIGLFSLKRNAKTLFSTTKSSNDISCLHGLRFLSMYLIVYGHRYIHNMATPVVNYMDLVDWLETYYSTTVHGGTTTVDTFFLVSSTLLSFMFFNMLSKGIKINLLLFYLNRHLRLLVPIALAASTYATVIKHFGGGPLYHDMTVSMGIPCKYFWWSTLLYMQPLINSRTMCIVQTWYLSVDTFWYYLSPIMLFTLANNQIVGYLVMLAFYSLCTMINFYVAWVYKFNGQMPVTPGLLETDYFCLHYTQPLVRGGPYIIGLAFGHALFRTKDRKVPMSTVAKIIGWIVVSVCLPLIVLMTRSFRLEDFEYNRMFASLFLACHRSIWTFGIIWIVWCCQNGHGEIVNAILSWNGFKILGRLCYNIFLFHFVFQGAMQNSKKTPSYFSDYLSIYDSISDIVLMIILAVPLTLCFEYPFVRICALIFKPNAKGKSIKVVPSQQQTNKL